MKKAIWIIVSFLLLLIVCIPVKLFLIGEPLDAPLVHCTVTEENGQLTLDVTTPASAIAFRGWKYRQEGSHLYISCRKVLVSPLFSSGDYHTIIDTVKLDRIYLGRELIWSSEQASETLNYARTAGTDTQ